MRVLLISTYALGHQPVHLGIPASALRAAGHEVQCLDLAVEPWDPARVGWAEAVAVSVPMHTAMRLALQVAQAIRVTGSTPICLYGLYAGASGAQSDPALIDRVIAGEYLPELVRWVSSGTAKKSDTATAELPAGDVVQLGRHPTPVPDRRVLPALDRYARLAIDGEERLVGYVEASHGCIHRCRHCPVPVVYDGRIRIVGADVVHADIAQLVDSGARHITFGDPDFLNGAQHSKRVVQAMHAAFPDLTFDCTTKVEHILAHGGLWADLAEAGCLFVVSAFESLNDTILERLDKGHTAAEAAEAVALLRTHGIEIRPSWLPFTPWTTIPDILDILDFVISHDLVGNVDPVQYTIRLLLPVGSLLLDHPDMGPHLGPFDPDRLGWTWTAIDPRLDALQSELAALVEDQIAAGAAIGAVFAEMDATVRRAAGLGPRGSVARGTPDRPRLTESWFCCSEPTGAQLANLLP